VKWKNKVYLLAFLGGVVVINMFGSKVSSGMLNRYSLVAMSFDQIVYEEYFLNVLFLRLRTVLGLWIASMFIPPKWVMLLFGGIICSFLGGIVALAIMENGLWGVWFCAGAFFLHGICYGLAYAIWSNRCVTNMSERNRKESHFMVAMMMLLIGIGSVLEAYISPVILQNIIKY